MADAAQQDKAAAGPPPRLRPPPPPRPAWVLPSPRPARLPSPSGTAPDSSRAAAAHHKHCYHRETRREPLHALLHHPLLLALGRRLDHSVHPRRQILDESRQYLMWKEKEGSKREQARIANCPISVIYDNQNT